ncbi:MAG: zinc ribbon domain-containing protein [Methanocellales archaeon]|nr:zinc ribbon domain-containing protein [Methanocellales archaeon]
MIKMKNSNDLICQSCGMPLKSDEDFGTNSDCSKNEEYCQFCYQKGKYTDKGITMEQKIEKNIEIAKKMGMSEERAKEMANNIIPKLKR